MSNFACDKCGIAIIDSPRGYITSCEHYPIGNLVKSQVDIPVEHAEVINELMTNNVSVNSICGHCGETIHPLNTHVFCKGDGDYMQSDAKRLKNIARIEEDCSCHGSVICNPCLDNLVVDINELASNNLVSKNQGNINGKGGN